MATINQLNEARDAYHKLLTGKSVVTLKRDGKEVSYTPADRLTLQKYIDDLERGLGQTSRRAGPAGVC